MAHQTPALSQPPSPAATSSQPQPAQLTHIALDQITESTTNPRRTRNPEHDKELIESVRAHGVLQPVLVRKHGKGYELVAGSRRLRAALAAGLKQIPATVRELTDEQAMELQIVENLQRDDIQPIEEGRGYTQLIAALAKKDPKRAPDGQGVRRQDLVLEVARMVGKSARYVYARMKLCELIPELQKDLEEGRIDASHADELVRLTPKDQKEVRDCCLYMDEPVEDPNEKPGEYVKVWKREQGERSISVRNLKVIIEREYQLTLDKAKFDINSNALTPVRCTACPKNTAVNPLLPPAKVATCTDKECWRNKMRQHCEAQARELGKKAPKKELVQITLAHRGGAGVKARPTWKSAKPGECRNVQPAVQVDERGGVKHFTMAKTVCLEKKCKTHWAPATTTTQTRFRDDETGEQRPFTLKELREYHEEALENEIGGEARDLALLKAVVAKVDKLGEHELRLMVDFVSGRHYHSAELQEVLGTKDANVHTIAAKAKPAELPRVLFAVSLLGSYDLGEDAGFLAYAKKRGVDPGAVGKAMLAAIPRCAICGCFKEHGCDLGGGKRCAWLLGTDPVAKALKAPVCSNPLCVAEAKKRAGVQDAPAAPKKPAQASAKGKPAKAAGKKGGRR